MSNDYCSDITRAVREDSVKRELYQHYAPTPQERREAERRAIAQAFETGDHQPDGTVVQREWTFGNRLLDAKIEAAMDRMDAYLIQRAPANARARGNNHGVLATAMGSYPDREEEMVSVQVFMRVPAVDAERLRGAMTDHPEWLEKMLRGLQLEAGYALEHTFGVVSNPVE